MPIKTCPVHGPLRRSQCYINKAGVSCKQCKKSREKSRRDSDLATHNMRKRELRDLNLDKVRAQERASRARHKPRVSAANRRYYRENIASVKANVRSYQLRTKIEVLTHYAGGEPACASCGDGCLRHLGLDHIDGGGKKHKRSIGGSGGYVYLWARKNNYPPIFQVLCHNCNQKKEPRNSGSYHLRLKSEVLTHYGNGKLQCVACPESDLRALTIDHINGNGASHRRELNTKSGLSFYLLLKRTGYPEGLQTLCFNHNLGKRCLG